MFKREAYQVWKLKAWLPFWRLPAGGNVTYKDIKRKLCGAE